MDSREDDVEQEEASCPFCATTGACEHLLLAVDQTFRTAVGGRLYKAFDTRWGAMLDREDPEDDEADRFDELLAEIDGLADACCDYAPDAGPGMSSSFSAYYCSSEDRILAAALKFG